MAPPEDEPPTGRRFARCRRGRSVAQRERCSGARGRSDEDPGRAAKAQAIGRHAAFGTPPVTMNMMPTPMEPILLPIITTLGEHAQAQAQAQVEVGGAHDAEMRRRAMRSRPTSRSCRVVA